MIGILALLVTLNATSVGPLPPASTCQEGLAKQAEIIQAQDEAIALQDEKIARLEAAMTEHKKAGVSLQAEVDAQAKMAETYKKLWQAEMEYTSRVAKRANWAERWVALKWVGIGFAGGVLATEVAK